MSKDRGYRLRERGMSVVVVIALIPLAIIGIFVLVSIFLLGQRAYWDARVRDMCARDGGVNIVSKLQVSKQDAELMSVGTGKLGIPDGKNSNSKIPVYVELSRTVIQ